MAFIAAEYLRPHARPASESTREFFDSINSGIRCVLLGAEKTLTGFRSAKDKHLEAQSFLPESQPEFSPTKTVTFRDGTRQTVRRDEFINQPFSVFVPGHKPKNRFRLKGLAGQAQDESGDEAASAQASFVTREQALAQLPDILKKIAAIEHALDNSFIGRSAIHFFGKREIELEQRRQQLLAKCIKRTRNEVKLAELRNSVDRLFNTIHQGTSWIEALNKSFFGAIGYELIYKKLLSSWFGRGVKAAWTFSIDKIEIIGPKKAGALAGLSLQEIAGRIEERVLKDEHGFGVRTGSITPDKLREAIAGGIDLSFQASCFTVHTWFNACHQRAWS